jgi:hypothetical protein
MKFLRIATFALCAFLTFGSAEAQHRNTSRPNYSGGKHSKSHGGHYQGQQNPHHKGGHYKNPRSGNQQQVCAFGECKSRWPQANEPAIQAHHSVSDTAIRNNKTPPTGQIIRK